MHSIRRQLATFLAVLAVLYAGGFAAGLIIENGEDDEPPAHERR